MGKTILLLAMITACVASGNAQTSAQTSPQTSGYQVDNFDFANAVKIETPKVEPPKESSVKRLTSLRNYTHVPAPGALIHLTSQSVNPSLGRFTTGNTDVDKFIVESGQRNSVDPLLLYAIMHQESSFKAKAMSHKGARGLMQLMPFTARRFGVTNIWDPKQNIEGGARYMKFLLDLFSGDVRLALAGYNAGEGAVRKYGFEVPPYAETREYVRRIGRRYSIMRDPQSAENATAINKGQQKDPIPLNVYERSVFMARLPDGRLQLVSQ